MQFLGRYFGQQTADDRVIRDAFYEFLCPEMGRQPLLLTLRAPVSAEQSSFGDVYAALSPGPSMAARC